MPNSIEYTKRYTTILDEVYQRSSVSGCLTSPRHMVREGRNAREILIPRVNVTGLGDYKRNVGYATGAIEWSFESHSPDYDRGIKLVADTMDTDNVNASSRAFKNQILKSLREWHPVPAMTQCMDCLPRA